MDELEITIEEGWEDWLKQEHHQAQVREIQEESHPNRGETSPQANLGSRLEEYAEIELMTDEEDVDEIQIIIVSDDEAEAILPGSQTERKRKRRKRPAKRKPKSKKVNKSNNDQKRATKRIS
jgi:hypothetical protein